MRTSTDRGSGAYVFAHRTRVKIGVFNSGLSYIVPGNPMNFSHFLRIERDAEGRPSTHHVVHTHDPKFSLELLPDGEAPNKIGQGVIKRIRVPNSWAGDYGQYAKLITAAQEFFNRSFAEPAAKSETRRFKA